MAQISTMKYFFLFAMTFCLSVASGQTVRFEPNWKMGDSYQIDITTVKQTTEKEETEETTEYIDLILSVEGEGYKHYGLSLEYKDVMQSKLLELADEYDWEVEPVDLRLEYRVSKVDGSYSLTNFEDAREFMNQAIEDMTEGFASMSEDESAEFLFAMIMAPLSSMFESEEVLSSYFGEAIDELLIPFYKDFDTQQELKIVEAEENPVAPGDTLSATIFLSLPDYEITDKQVVVNTRTELDFTPYVEMLKPMIEGMMRGFASIDTTASEAKIDSVVVAMNQMFDEMSMDGKMTSSITFDQSTGWPSSATGESIFDMNMGEMQSGKVEVYRTMKFTKLR